MRSPTVLVLVAALLQVSMGSHVSIQMPYQNPAGVTYINHAAPLTYAPGAPLQYAAPAAPVHYTAAPAPLQYAPAVAPVQYAAAVPAAKIQTHHVGYAHAQVPAVAAVPFVKHVPTISQVPVTRIEAHPAVLEKQVDVLKPAISTRKVEVRRPAIQKQFYDIEERVIVRPAGSALVELEEPTSKLERGPAVIQALQEQPVLHSHLALSPVISAQSHGYLNAASIQLQQQRLQQQQFQQMQLQQQQLHQLQHQQNQASSINPTPNPSSFTSSTLSGVSAATGELESDSVVVENADFRSFQQQQQQQQQQQLQKHQPLQQHQQQREQLNSFAFSQVRTSAGPQVSAQSNGVPIESSPSKFIAHDPSPVLVASQRSSNAEENQSNQNRLIELLTAHGGVVEVGFGRDGGASIPIGDAGQVRARVISATPAPENAEPSGERVSTRRVVVNRPIETLQELDIVEPAHKLERVSVQQPTFIKTARLDHVQVHGSVPVYGKALAPAVAHAAVPVYQKTISPALAYYHRK